MAGRPPEDLLLQFVEDTLTLNTKELAEKYERARSTIGEWRAYARGQGHKIGFGTGPDTVSEPSIFGLTAEGIEGEEPIERLWDRALEHQELMERKMALRRGQVVELPNEPAAIVYFSDAHFGSPSMDYRSARRDAEIVAETDGMWAEFHGDLGENWIVGKLTAQSWNQGMTLTHEGRLAVDWLSTIGEKMLIVVAGNHDNWSYQLSGVDQLRQSLPNKKVLYDPHEVVFDLKVGASNWRHKIRHKWRGHSKFNATHGIEVSWENDPFDIGLGGHTHSGTWCRPFAKGGERRWAIMTGTYKMEDGYARQLGLPTTVGLGSGAMVYHPDGRCLWCDDVENAADVLSYWRQ